MRNAICLDVEVLYALDGCIANASSFFVCGGRDDCFGCVVPPWGWYPAEIFWFVGVMLRRFVVLLNLCWAINSLA